MGKKRILLLFPDGVGIRNYLYSDIFKNADAELVLYHSFDQKTVVDIKNTTGIAKDIVIPKYSESAKEKFLRELICLCRLKQNAKQLANPTLLTNWNTNHKKLSKKLFYKLIEWVSLGVKNYDTILKLEHMHQKSMRNNPFYEKVTRQIQEIKPDVVFCSHQRAVQAAPIFEAASDLGIKTTTVVFSWDNLPKARMAVKADKYLVWSDYMKQEMKGYYPEISEEDVLVTGTPQFEFYGNPSNIIPKDIFYKQYNLDTDKKIICYSGDDALTSPDDPMYLENLADELQKHNLEDEYQILLRRCPVDLSGRFDLVIQKYPDLIKVAPPVWNFKDKNDWTVIYPLFEDVKLLVSTAYYCDVVLNVGSTMAFDFGMFNKPCIFINYDQPQKKVKKWSVDTIYQFEHFKSMPDSRAVIWLNNKEEIVSKIHKALNNYSANHIADWKERVIGNHLTSSQRIRKVLEI
ncbi:hypothetical protein [Flavobacterium sp. GCM10023249]|uniref:hypothetical protein n=1 Tax=unclassified Flavobacterium TaxID=196869 RepID=UPI0036105F57